MVSWDFSKGTFIIFFYYAFSDEFIIQISSNSIQSVKFSIVTHTGQTIYNGIMDLLAGENNKAIDLSSIEYKGLMILSIFDENNNVFRSKLIKL